MEIFLENFEWMVFNLFLAFLAVLFGWLFLKSKKVILQLIFFLLWFLFVPNTVYLVTDLQYIPEQWSRADTFFKLLISIQYLILILMGPVTFILGMYPVDKVFKEIHLRKHSELRILILIVLNFLIGFAVVLGKFLRTNSWDVLTNFDRVISDALILLSDQNLVLLGLGFGIFTNFLYFGYKYLKK